MHNAPHMTLILTAVTHRCAILAADRRTMAFNKKTGGEFVLSDKAEKLLVGQNIAVAVMSDADDSRATGRDILARWIQEDYDPERPLREQIEALHVREFSAGSKGGFVAVQVSDREAQFARTLPEGGMQFDAFEPGEPKGGKLKFAGSGSEIATQLVELIKPPLSAYDTAELVDLCAFLIRSTHSVQRFAKRDEPKIGADIAAAVLTPRGVELVLGGKLDIDDNLT